MIVYGSVNHALGCAFSAPIARYAATSVFSKGVGRSYDAMTPEERMAINGHVQRIAMEHCHARSIRCFRILYDDDSVEILEAMQGVIESFRKPSKRPPDEWCVAIIQRWAHRKVLKVPNRNDKEWAKALDVNRKTVWAARKDLTTALKNAHQAGVRVMEAELEARGLILGGRTLEVA